MKILHIVAGELNGGAARGAYWLHGGLVELGINSRIYTNSKITLGDDNVITTSLSKRNKAAKIIRSQLDKLLPVLYSNREKKIFSSGMFGSDFTKTKEYKDANIIHIHWVNDGFINIKHLSKINKPLVWTLRDMWPMTGGCHYAMECVRYKVGCGKCEQLRSNNNYDLSKIILNRKKKYLPKNMFIVGISHWLSEQARESEIFRKFNIRTVSNNINIKEFFPINKIMAKKILGIETEKKIILTGATRLDDFYKGFESYIKALKRLNTSKYFLCFFGNMDNVVAEKLGFEYKNFGYLNDNISLRLIYSSANVFVAPSRMDAFGKTIAESMACGTPVVCYDATGPKDIVSHQIDGYKAKPFDTDDLANGIDWVLNSSDYNQLCLNAREKVLKEFDSVVVAKKYIKLYEEILK